MILNILENLFKLIIWVICFILLSLKNSQKINYIFFLEIIYNGIQKSGATLEILILN